MMVTKKVPRAVIARSESTRQSRFSNTLRTAKLRSLSRVLKQDCFAFGSQWRTRDLSQRRLSGLLTNVSTIIFPKTPPATSFDRIFPGIFLYHKSFDIQFCHTSFASGGTFFNREEGGGYFSISRRCFVNHSAARRATSSSAPGSSKRCVAPGMILSSFSAFRNSKACRFSLITISS